MEEKYLAFKIENDFFLITIHNVHSIIQKQDDEIRSIPNAPQYVQGISSLREKALLIINGQKLFNKKTEQRKEYATIVLKDKDKFIGMIVDEVIAVIQIDEDLIQTKNSLLFASSLIQGVYLKQEDIYLVLNPDKLLNLEVLAEETVP